MFEDEQEVISWLYGFKIFRENRNLEGLKQLLEKLDNPHLKLRTVHIAGTNGKGSTVSYIRQAFMASGYKVATFTSPFITSFGERISINNNPIDESSLVSLANELKQVLTEDESVTSFDLITVLSFMHFVKEGVDIAIYETGIGGRIDSTNVILPLVTAITNVGHDHAEILGDSQILRAKEKLGIVKDNIALFTTEEDLELQEMFKDEALKKNAQFIKALDKSTLVTLNSSGAVFDCCGYDGIEISMYGEHQFKNATLAVCMLEYLRKEHGFANLSPYAIKETKWQGRFEYISKKPDIILDGAHNLEGIDALISTVSTLYKDVKVNYIFSALSTKDASVMVEKLAKTNATLTFTTSSHPLALDAKILATYCLESNYYEDYTCAINEMVSKALETDVLIFCGSLYFISDVRNYLLNEEMNCND